MGPSPIRIVRGDDTRSDAEIAEALKRGDRGAELEAWNRFSPGTAQTLRRLLGPGPDREDLLQEVYLRFFRNVRSLREPAAVRGFLAGISVRVVRQEIARRRRSQWLRLTPTGDAPDAPGPAADVESRNVIARCTTESLSRRPSAAWRAPPSASPRWSDRIHRWRRLPGERRDARRGPGAG